MPYEIYQTSAENVIAATDAAIQKPEGVDENLVAAFLDTTPQYARDALQMARELSLLAEFQAGRFRPFSKCATYLCTAQRDCKAAILRFVLEQYEPYQTFKSRLELSGVVGEAATQTKALHNLPARREVISSTFCDLGTYAQSLISEGGGLYKPREDGRENFLAILDSVIQNRETAASQVRSRLGEEAVAWIDKQNVFENLVTAYQRAAVAHQDARAPIVHAGNAIESFLSQLAGHRGVNVQNAHGINAKADALGNAGYLLSKHKFMVKYLGHVRNAADHGIDADIGTQWDISPNTSVEFVYVAQSVIAVLVGHVKNRFIV
jgi:hypothetical protein